ncbi:MAG: hypothetical protein NTZ26_07090, partial [Candidatus Aminicenantes bacterium]|nr:hypothetical protein [Candidatus Aminicenantes bacterium]
MSRSDKSRGKGRAARFALSMAAVGMFAFLTAAAQAIPVGAKAVQAASIQPSVPEPGFAPGWAKAGPLRTFTGQDLFNQIDGGAELFLEFGFARMRLQAFARGKSELTLNAYEMESA